MTRKHLPFVGFKFRVLLPRSWEDDPPDLPFLQRMTALCRRHGVKLLVDRKWHWRDSECATTESGEKHILAGGKGKPVHVSTVILHELGHHVVMQRGESKDMTRCEEQAWEAAKEFPRRERLPFTDNVMRRCLHGYRIGRQLTLMCGSVHRRKRAHAHALALSKRTKAAGWGLNFIALGKRGKRHLKRELKHAVAKSERRQGRKSLRGSVRSKGG